MGGSKCDDLKKLLDSAGADLGVSPFPDDIEWMTIRHFDGLLGSKDDGTPIRVAAAKELATDRDSRIDAASGRACSYKKWSVRAAAVYAIAKRDDPALLNAITPVLDDKNDIVRYDASAAVLRLGDGKTRE